MLTKLNRRQHAWLQTATPEQRKAFAAKGPAEVAELINLTTYTPYYMAGLRGLLFDNRQFDKAEDAGKHAETELAYLQADTTLPVLDEVALGIDGGNATLNDQLEQATIRAEQILHLGAMLTQSDDMPDALIEFIDDLDSHIAKALATDMPWLQEMLTRWDSVDGVTDEEARDDFNTMAYRHACYGYLVQYATPVMKPRRCSNGEWSGASFSWGCYSTAWFYGETLEETVTKALAWAEGLRQQEITEAEAKESGAEVAA